MIPDHFSCTFMLLLQRKGKTKLPCTVTYKLPGSAIMEVKCHSRLLTPATPKIRQKCNSQLEGEGHLPKIYPTQWVQMRRQWKWLHEHSPSQTQQLWWVLKSPSGIFFRKAFLHISACIQVSSIIFKSSACPTPTTVQPVIPSWDQTQRQPSSALEWWITCSGHSAWVPDPLNNRCLKHRELFFPRPWVWLLYRTPGMKMQSFCYCHRKDFAEEKGHSRSKDQSRV